MTKVKMLFISLFTLLLLVGCGADEVSKTDAKPENAEQEKVKIVTTYSILYDIVKNVGGERVDIHSLAPVGSNPHEYDPLPEDVQKTTDADIVFYNGLNLESGNSWFENLMLTAGKSGQDAPVFRLSEGVKPKYLTTKGKEGEEDPHAWLDIQNGIKYAENAREALIKVDPEHAEVYQKNAETYIQQLKVLHQKALDQFNEIPKEKRYLITSEGAFKYFCEAYDFEAGYIWEINDENQGTPQQVLQVVQLIQSKQVPVLFVETSVDRRSMEMVSKETGVPIGGVLFTDSLGKPGENGDSYIRMVESNINVIVDNLKKYQ